MALNVSHVCMDMYGHSFRLFQYGTLKWLLVAWVTILNWVVAFTAEGLASRQWFRALISAFRAANGDMHLVLLVFRRSCRCPLLGWLLVAEVTSRLSRYLKPKVWHPGIDDGGLLVFSFPAAEWRVEMALGL